MDLAHGADVSRTKQALVRRINAFLTRPAGGDQRPAFFDIDATFPALRALDRQQDVIAQELDALLHERERIPRYHDVSSTETYISATVNPDKAWRVFMLATVDGEVQANASRCPNTMAALRQVPDLLGAFFSILDPGKSIPAHDGPYTGYLRYHLALKVPRDNPPSLRVKDQHHTWQLGQSILFDDSWNHEVTNLSSGTRVVLIVDVLRPLPLPYRWVNLFLTKALGRYSEEVREIRANLRKYA
ncbi:MAG: aspartyl/asparaginyl beta-hydroxylase domain-containing protein [Hydrogenophaga sp.]|uniref:aspartyl/asparaginyl beta-hydroxylase domain-containing protein n=1 Tax=Hydrogenophaga sp. TaxID=1904254 RepID=UPI001D8ACADB|nr:aspartyl/asparaginyl beta-hydroxylase domain-containing protein [Hydrogenophaga sp.]MBX3609155.1 aspartyl/asparaginyl beta-hydroxylase domain-containing protein [Hydrogenophaga sp.]